ncbi:hypothetical protein C9422_18740 [Pseudomonas sp. B1(2018)]|uniref:hypothetical protein n=1 Tax=Pseudomonas sp. B1(2018) TaxID=2233856 RepID=UPI000D5E7749|nr:hypothetical protein [Pseudomonas sp. B1(2018)]PVZ56560.1 hypothetical protein C9422_18740 [Pseudomonas sp. B1(2018)]
MKTIQVKAWGKGQGDFVLINEEDFVEGEHELYVAKKLTAKEQKAFDAANEAAAKLEATKAALTEKGIAFEVDASQEDLQALLDAEV